jgi:hypothetical protein
VICAEEITPGHAVIFLHNNATLEGRRRSCSKLIGIRAFTLNVLWWLNSVRVGG